MRKGREAVSCLQLKVVVGCVAQETRQTPFLVVSRNSLGYRIPPLHFLLLKQT